MSGCDDECVWVPVKNGDVWIDNNGIEDISGEIIKTETQTISAEESESYVESEVSDYAEEDPSLPVMTLDLGAINGKVTELQILITSFMISMTTSRCKNCSCFHVVCIPVL